MDTEFHDCGLKHNYNSFRRSFSAFDVSFAGINEIRRAINVFTARWILQCNIFFFSFDSICILECVLFVAMKKHKQMIKTKTLNLKHKKSWEIKTRFGAWWQGFEQSVWREQSTKKYTMPSKWVIIVITLFLPAKNLCTFERLGQRPLHQKMLFVQKSRSYCYITVFSSSERPVT